MNKARKLLVQASQKLDLPPDVIAGIPRMELIGAEEFSLEPHKGLMEYSEDRISVSTSVGVITAIGADMKIKRMNGARITVTGKLHQIHLFGGRDE